MPPLARGVQASGGRRPATVRQASGRRPAGAGVASPSPPSLAHFLLEPLLAPMPRTARARKARVLIARGLADWLDEQARARGGAATRSSVAEDAIRSYRDAKEAGRRLRLVESIDGENRVVLPPEVLDAIGVRPGGKVTVAVDGGDVRLRKG